MSNAIDKVYSEAAKMIKAGKVDCAIDSILCGEIVVLTSAIKHLTGSVQNLGNLMQLISVSKLPDFQDTNSPEIDRDGEEDDFGDSRISATRKINELDTHFETDCQEKGA